MSAALCAMEPLHRSDDDVNVAFESNIIVRRRVAGQVHLAMFADDATYGWFDLIKGLIVCFVYQVDQQRHTVTKFIFPLRITFAVDMM